MGTRCNAPRKIRFGTLRGALKWADKLRTPRPGHLVADHPLVPYLCRSGKHYHLCSAMGSKPHPVASR